MSASSSSERSSSPPGAGPSGASSFDAASAERFAESLVPEWEATLHSVEVVLSSEDPADVPPEDTVPAEKLDPENEMPSSAVADAAPSVASAPASLSVEESLPPGHEEEEPVVSGLEPRTGTGRGKLWVGIALGVVALGGLAFASMRGEDDVPTVEGASASQQRAPTGGRGASMKEGDSKTGEAPSQASKKEGLDAPSDPRPVLQPTAEETQEEMAAVPEPEREPPPAVEVKVVVLPESAQLYLDGQRVDNPLLFSGAPEARQHRLEARAEGYQPVRRVLRFDASRQVRIELKPRPEPRERARSRQVARRARARSHVAASRRTRKVGSQTKRHGGKGRRVRRIITESPY